jgi:hypothetical protein
MYAITCPHFSYVQLVHYYASHSSVLTVYASCMHICTHDNTGMYFETDLDDIAFKKQQQQQQADTSSSSSVYDVKDDNFDILSILDTTKTLPRLTAHSSLDLEVTYDVFLAVYWPKMVSKFDSMSKTPIKLDPSLVWTEIRSHIKGSSESLSSTGKLHIQYTMLLYLVMTAI